MKKKNEKVPGFDEIIFENRNKEYGAYDLRKKYLPATFWSIIGGVVLFSGLIITLSLTMEKDAAAVNHKEFYIISRMDSSLIDVNKLKPDVPPVQKPEIKVDVYVAPVIVDKVDSTDKGMMANSVLDSTNTNRPVDNNIVPVNDPDPVIPVNPEPVVIVTEMPIFPGGNEAMLKYIYDNIIYPPIPLENGVEGRVTLKFVIWTDGSVRRIEILKGVDPMLDQEAVRVISQMPKWKPGKNNGTPAAVWFSVPVTFRIKRN